jgi:hypothetical protein
VPLPSFFEPWCDISIRIVSCASSIVFNRRIDGGIFRPLANLSSRAASNLPITGRSCATWCFGNVQKTLRSWLVFDCAQLLPDDIFYSVSDSLRSWEIT